MDVFTLVARLLLDKGDFDTNLEGARRSAEGAEDSIGGVFSKINTMGKNLENTGNKIKEVGSKFTVLSGAATGALGAAIKITADFDSQMSKVSAIAGATGKDFDDLRNKAREMGEKTKFSATEAGQAFEYMAMAGWSTKDMITSVDGVMNLAAASGVSLARTSDIVTDAMTAFGLSADGYTNGIANATHFSDVLAQVSRKANTNVDLLGESFKYVAPVAGSFKFSVEDISVALGLMANAGIKASTAGTSLRTLLTNMSKPTDDMLYAMNKLGISMDDGAGNMYSFREIMDQLRAGFGDIKFDVEAYERGLNDLNGMLDSGAISESEYEKQLDLLVGSTLKSADAQKAQLAAMLAGKQGLSGLMAIVNASPEDYEKLIEAMDNCDGAALEMAETMQDNLGGQITILFSQLSELAISIGDLLMPKIRDVVGWIQKAVDWINGLDEGQKNMIATIGLVIAAIAPVLVVLGTVISSIGSIVAVINGPLLLAIGAIIAIAVVVMNNWDAVRNFFETTLMPVLQTLGEKFLEIKDKYLIPLAEYVIGKFKEAWNNLKEFMGTVFEAIGKLWETTLKPAFESIASFVTDTVKPKLETAWEGVKNVVELAFDAISDLWESILKPAFEAIASFVTETLAPQIKDAWETIKDVVGKAFEAIAGLWDTVLKPAFAAVVTYVTETLKPNLQTAWETIKTVVSTAFNAISDLWETILKPAFSAIGETIKNLKTEDFEPFVDFLTTTFKGAWDELRDFWENVLMPKIELLKTAFKEFKDEILKPYAEFLKNTYLAAWKELKRYWTEDLQPRLTELQKAFNHFKEKVLTPIAGFIQSTFLSVFESIGELFNTTLSPSVETISDTFRSLWENCLEPLATFARDEFADAFSTVEDVFSGLIDFITDVFYGNWQAAWDDIVDIFGTLFGGIVDIAKEPVNALIDVLNSLIDGVEWALNAIIDGFNMINVTIPSWVPAIGGNSFGINIPHVTWGRVNYLANGGVLGEGERAVVGEKEAEFLSVVNGKAVVQPMGGRLSNREQKPTQNITFNIYPVKGQSEEEIARAVERKFTMWDNQRKAAYA